nr:uncharacterized protein LOC126524219 [Dermacentor andersoni]
MNAEATNGDDPATEGYPEDPADGSWLTARGRRGRRADAKSDPAARRQKETQNLNQTVPRRPQRPPPMPIDDFKAILRPRNGLTFVPALGPEVQRRSSDNRSQLSRPARKPPNKQRVRQELAKQKRQQHRPLAQSRERRSGSRSHSRSRSRSWSRSRSRGPGECSKNRERVPPSSSSSSPPSSPPPVAPPPAKNPHHYSNSYH